ncbi:MAG: hypothetical protein PUB08_05585 [Firmicutes bacterium]|nr:hypothetical protein [Bacillota bacterium]
MKFTEFTQDMSIISAMPDRPTPENGFTAARIKELFDKAGVDIQTYINTVLIPELESASEDASGADRIGHTAIDGIEGRTVGAQLKALKSYIDLSLSDAAVGILPNGSISAEQLSNELMNSLTLGSNYGVVIFKNAGEYTFTAPKDGIYRVRMAGGGGSGTMSVGDNNSGSIACPGGASAGCVECFVYLKRGSVSGISVGAGGKGLSESLTVGEEIDKVYYGQNLRLYTESEGKETVFGSDEIGFFIHCPGASNTEKRFVSVTEGTGSDLSRAGHIVSDTVLERRGESGKYDNAVSETGGSPDGADSLFGCGGSNVNEVSPGAGCGGSGGTLNNKLASKTVEALPQKGGDGIVIIEYVGL